MQAYSQVLLSCPQAVACAIHVEHVAPIVVPRVSGSFSGLAAARIKTALLLGRLGPRGALLPLTLSFEEWSVGLWFTVWLHFNRFL